MNRREFLKVSLMSAVSYVALGPMGNFLNADVEAVVAGKTYRGTKDGKIMVSGNGGKSWQLHTKFGANYTVLNIFTAKDNHLYARIGHKKSSFYLILAKDGKAWLSQPFKTQPKPR